MLQNVVELQHEENNKHSREFRSERTASETGTEMGRFPKCCTRTSHSADCRTRRIAVDCVKFLPLLVGAPYTPGGWFLSRLDACVSYRGAHGNGYEATRTNAWGKETSTALSVMAERQASSMNQEPPRISAGECQNNKREHCSLGEPGTAGLRAPPLCVEDPEPDLGNASEGNASFIVKQ